MLQISIPDNFIPERKYIIDVLFKELLNLKYGINITKKKDYFITLENGKEIYIKDHFFSKFKDNLNYLHEINIPQKIKYFKNQFTFEKNIPVIYGTDELKVLNNKIICGIDIFASSFFMLTRWEEYVDNTRDEHNRFPSTASLAYMHNFLDRPIVNEYVEMLWNMLKYLGMKQERGKREFNLILTHDVDQLYFWKNKKQLVRIMTGDIIKRQNIKLAFERLAEFYLVSKKKINDPYDTFEWFMDKSEAIGIKSRFFFMSGGSTIYENSYYINEPKALRLIKYIKDRGHIIGFHPSYNTYNNMEQWRKEKSLLEHICKYKIEEGRQHYLRFEVPTTWQIWEDNDMEVDSTCCYADKEGFRCGVCYEYSVFNILTRKKLHLKERPLIVMEQSIINREDVKPINVERKILFLKNRVKKYNGSFVFLWHNANINTQKRINYKYVYDKVIDLRN